MTHLVPTGTAECELRVSASRFFAFLAPAGAVEEAQRFVAELQRRHPDATHHVFAWRVGWPPAERSSDAGEPAGTAGAPVLRALRAAELSNVVTVVARWFGGTKLGKGGLARAYGGVVRQALAELPVRRETPRVRLVVELPAARAGAVRRLLRPPEVELVSERWGESAELELSVALERRAAVEAALAELGVTARAR